LGRLMISSPRGGLPPVKIPDAPTRLRPDFQKHPQPPASPLMKADPGITQHALADNAQSPTSTNFSGNDLSGAVHGTDGGNPEAENSLAADRALVDRLFSLP
jgi:hypothetical protein